MTDNVSGALNDVNVRSGTVVVGGTISSSTVIEVSGGYVKAQSIQINTNTIGGIIRITITGGIVEADTISVYNSNTGGSVIQNLTIDGDTVVFASSITNQNKDVASTKGVVFIGNAGNVYGSVTLPGDITIPEGYTLDIETGDTLIVPQGTTLTNYGTINMNGGTLTNNGTIVNYGTINGTVGGNAPLVPSAVTVRANPDSVAYGGSVTLTANVVNAANGTVMFYHGTADNGTSLGSANVSNGTATLNNVQINSTNGFTTGPNTITAVYSGGNGLLGNSGTAELTVNKATPPVTPTPPSNEISVSENSIMLMVVQDSSTDTYGDIQYGYTTDTETIPGHWQDGTEFTGLQSGTDYTFYTRFAGNEYYEVSGPSTTGLIVTTQPAITSTSLAEGYVGVEYSGQLTASVASDKTVTWALANNSSLPAGLTLNSNGTITGNPTATGTFNFTVQAAISGGPNGKQVLNTADLSITINTGTLATPTGLAWSSTNTGTATWNEVPNATGYSVQLYKDNEKVGEPVSVTDGTSHDFSRAIDGAGSYTFTVTATTTDSTNYNNSEESGQSAALNYYAITVNGADHGSVTVTDGNGNPVTFALSGTEITLTPLPDANYHLGGWTVNAGGVTVSNNTFTVGSEDVEITPVFEVCSGGSASYFKKAVYATCGREYGSFLTDTTLPEGEITLGTDHWKSFLNTITRRQLFACRLH